MQDFVRLEPDAKSWIRPFMSGEDFIYCQFRYCLWLKDITPLELRKMKLVMQRVEKVRKFRLESKAEATRKKATTPTLFAQIAQPKSNYLAIPEVSSEKRVYIPIGFLSPDVIASNTIQLVANAEIWHFGILSSLMHMTWTKTVCGRLKSDIRYSNGIVYNNFPWPENPTEKQKQAVEQAAQAVLNARAQFPDSSLADLYDPNTMPPVLVKAHQALDRAVDLCYRSQPFISDSKRMEFLFELYDKYTAGLFANEKKGKRK
jgi:hypothetical protein